MTAKLRALAILLTAAFAFADEPLTKELVLAEANLEKRSQKALDYGLTLLDRSRTAYDAGKLDEWKSLLNEALEAAELSYKSLEESGKAARRSPKYFKRAESRLRLMLRKLDSMEQAVSFEDRSAVQEVEKRINELHDNVVTDIMTKKKK